MKLLNEQVLLEFGFREAPHLVKENDLKVMTKHSVILVIRDDGIYYRNMGFLYPLKYISDLKKLYKELRREELQP
jgi:hypothetical protein